MASMSGEISATGTFTGVFVSCPEVRLDDGRTVMLQGGDIPQWQMKEGRRVQVRGQWARISVCQAPTIAVDEIELLD